MQVTCAALLPHGLTMSATARFPVLPYLLACLLGVFAIAGFWYGLGNGRDALWLGTANGGFVGSAVAMPGSHGIARSGDFDGNGRDDILFHGDPGDGDRLWRF